MTRVVAVLLLGTFQTISQARSEVCSFSQRWCPQVERCLAKNSECCGSDKRQCEKTCVGLNETCPEDLCQNQSRCADTGLDRGCFNHSQRCDGIQQCATGRDEQACPGPSGWVLVLVVCLALMFVLIFFCVYCLFCHKRAGGHVLSLDKCCRTVDEIHVVPIPSTRSGQHFSAMLPAGATWTPSTYIRHLRNNEEQLCLSSSPASQPQHADPPPSYSEVLASPDVYKPTSCVAGKRDSTLDASTNIHIHLHV